MTTYKENLQADTMRVGHHGSDGSSSQALIDAVKPNFALISCAKFNIYGLPNKTITDRYIAYFATHPDDEEHDLSYYTGKDIFGEEKIKKALWQTWSLGETKIGYSG